MPASATEGAFSLAYANADRIGALERHSEPQAPGWHRTAMGGRRTGSTGRGLRRATPGYFFLIARVRALFRLAARPLSCPSSAGRLAGSSAGASRACAAAGLPASNIWPLASAFWALSSGSGSGLAVGLSLGLSLGLTSSERTMPRRSAVEEGSHRTGKPRAALLGQLDGEAVALGFDQGGE